MVFLVISEFDVNFGLVILILGCGCGMASLVLPCCGWGIWIFSWVHLKAVGGGGGASSSMHCHTCNYPPDSTSMSSSRFSSSDPSLPLAYRAGS